MPFTRDNRLAIARDIIKKTGMPISKAMLAAGYAKSTARTSHRDNARRVLQDAQDEFVRDYMADLNIDALDPKSIKKTLGNIVRTGDNSEKIGAIGQHLKVILRRSDVVKTHEQGSVTINQNFIVPQQIEENTWKGKAIEAAEVVTVKKTKHKKL